MRPLAATLTALALFGATMTFLPTPAAQSQWCGGDGEPPETVDECIPSVSSSSTSAYAAIIPYCDDTTQTCDFRMTCKSYHSAGEAARGTRTCVAGPQLESESDGCRVPDGGGDCWTWEWENWQKDIQYGQPVCITMVAKTNGLSSDAVVATSADQVSRCRVAGPGFP